MRHDDIIQILLRSFTKPNLLELGSLRGKEVESFAAMTANLKVCVDLEKPSEPIQRILGEKCTYYPMSSEAFFSQSISDNVQYDIIYINNSHDCRQTYRDVGSALEFLSPNGVIVIHNCKPTNEVIGMPADQYQQVGREIKEKNHHCWTGDVWKAIVQLRSLREDLRVFTLDCDWGCAIVTRGQPESMLSFSISDIEGFGFSDLQANMDSFLNLKPPHFLFEYLFNSRFSNQESRSALYVEHPGEWVGNCLRDYFIDDPVRVHSIENGIVLPIKKVPGRINVWNGGVCDAEGNLVDGHKRNRDKLKAQGNCDAAYPLPSEIKHVNETVVYGGFLCTSFGHLITESLSRMWWLLENSDKNYRYAFVSPKFIPAYLEFFYLLGLKKEDILLISEPTQFDEVIIPDQTTFLFNGYKDKTSLVYDAIRDAVTPAPYEKVYLTKSQYSRGDVIGEEYFEHYYRDLGYEIIAPEKLTIGEQVAVMAGAKEVACTSGTLPHQILFCHDGVRLTVLNRLVDNLPVQFWMNEMRKAKCTFVDVSMNFLPAASYDSCYLLMPTANWRSYIHDQTGETVCSAENVGDTVLEYIIQWAKRTAVREWGVVGNYKTFNLVDLVVYVQKYLLGIELDNSTKEKLAAAFQ